MIVEGFQQSSILAKICLLVPLVPLVLSLAYAIRPTERRLALMRPLSLAAIFAALTGFAVGGASVLQGIGASASMDKAVGWGSVAVGTSEAMVPLFTTFACLTVAWLCVALGMRRNP